MGLGATMSLFERLAQIFDYDTDEQDQMVIDFDAYQREHEALERESAMLGFNQGEIEF